MSGLYKPLFDRRHQEYLIINDTSEDLISDPLRSSILFSSKYEWRFIREVRVLNRASTVMTVCFTKNYLQLRIVVPPIFTIIWRMFPSSSPFKTNNLRNSEMNQSYLLMGSRDSVHQGLTNRQLLIFIIVRSLKILVFINKETFEYDYLFYKFFWLHRFFNE